MQWLSLRKLKEGEDDFVLYQLNFIETPDKPFTNDNYATIYAWIKGDYHFAADYIEKECKSLSDVYKFNGKKFDENGLVKEAAEDIDTIGLINEDLMRRLEEKIKTITIQNNKFNIVWVLESDVVSLNLVVIGKFMLNNEEHLINIKIPYSYLDNKNPEEILKFLILKLKREVVKLLYDLIEDDFLKEFSKSNLVRLLS